MIVNPQLFNYRLIIGSLVIVIFGLSTFGYTKYNFLKGDKNFIEQEKALIQNELSQMISNYELIEIKNFDISVQLEKAKTQVNSILDTVNVLKSNASLLSGYKKQLQNTLISESFNELTVENSVSKTKVEGRTNIEYSRSVAKELKYKPVLKTKKYLNDSDFRVEGIKNKTKDGLIKTKFAAYIKQIHVQFNLDDIAVEFKKDESLYVQVLGPRNNIVADKGKVYFGKMALIYTEKLKFNYLNQDLKTNLFIKINPSESLVCGTYFVRIYYNGNRLGGTSVYFK